MEDWIIRLVEWGHYWGVALLMLLETIFPPIPSEVIINFEGISQWIHLLVATPAFSFLRLLQPFSERFRMVFRNRGIHCDRNVRYDASKQSLPDPFASPNRVRAVIQ